MATGNLRFGSWDLPLGSSVVRIERGRTIGSAKLARASGNRQTAGQRNGVSVIVKVPLFKGPLDNSDLRTRIDELRQYLAAGPGNLYVWDDRYYRCCEAVTEPDTFESTAFGRFQDTEVTFIGPDPLQYGSEVSDTWSGPSSGGTRSISTTGNAEAAPVFAITVGGAGAVTIAFTVTNSTTGESFTLSGSVTGGQVITVNCLEKTVKIGTTNYLSLFNGLFPKLSPGANTMTVLWTSGSISGIVTTHRPRWE